MKIESRISFGKTLVATCQIPTTDRGMCVGNIFELNNREDKDYFEKLKTTPQWNGSKFLRGMDCLMKAGSIGNTNDTFSLENSTGECLGYISIITHEAPHNKKFIYSIETAPQFSDNKKDKTIKHVGSSLVAFAVGQAKQENRKQVSTLAFDSDTRKFFIRHCGFKIGYESSYDCIIEQKHYSKFLEKYKEKMGNEIIFIK